LINQQPTLHVQLRKVKKANAFAKQEGASSNILSNEMNQKVEQYTSELMNKSFDEFTSQYFNHSKRTVEKSINCAKKGNLIFNLPWNRTFEATIDFNIVCQELKKD